MESENSRLLTMATVSEALEQIGQTLEACNVKKTKLLSQLDEVSRAIEIVRTECGCIDTTIA